MKSDKNTTAEKRTSFWTTLPGIFTGSAGLITAVGGLVAVLHSVGLIGTPADQPSSPPPPAPSTGSKCNEPWKWDVDLRSCVRTVTVPPKSFSILLEKATDKLDGRIDFYLNRERLEDKGGKAVYREARGKLQVVIPVMLGTRMIGAQREVIYSTNEGAICKVLSLPETTGHLKRMRVRYSLQLGSDCGSTGRFCRAGIQPGASAKRAAVRIEALTVMIGKNCN